MNNNEKNVDSDIVCLLDKGEKNMDIEHNEDGYMIDNEKDNIPLEYELIEQNDHSPIRKIRREIDQCKGKEEDDGDGDNEEEAQRKKREAEAEAGGIETIEAYQPIMNEDHNLLTLNNISTCQNCLVGFDIKDHIPYLLPCNHFFCYKCIKDFSNKSSDINCPIDGIVASSFNELTLLHHLIPKQISSSPPPIKQPNKPSNSFNNCSIHKDQKLTHFITNTKEIICIYCAFDRIKSNPTFRIREIKDISQEITSNLNQLLFNNQEYTKELEKTFIDLQRNKKQIDTQIIQVHDSLMQVINNQKKDYLSQVEKYFMSNAKALQEKLDVFAKNIDTAERLKENMQLNKDVMSLPRSIKEYEELINETNDKTKLLMTFDMISYNEDDMKRIRKILSESNQMSHRLKKIDFGGEIRNDGFKKKQLEIMHSEENVDEKMKRYHDEIYYETMNESKKKQGRNYVDYYGNSNDVSQYKSNDYDISNKGIGYFPSSSNYSKIHQTSIPRSTGSKSILSSHLHHSSYESSFTQTHNYEHHLSRYPSRNSREPSFLYEYRRKADMTSYPTHIKPKQI